MLVFFSVSSFFLSNAELGRQVLNIPHLYNPKTGDLTWKMKEGVSLGNRFLSDYSDERINEN